MPLIREASTREAPELVPENTYEVMCMDVKPETWEEDEFGNLQKLRWFLEAQDLFDSEGNPARIEAVCNDKWSEKATAWIWSEAFGLHPSYGEPTDIEDCIGKKALAQVAIRKSKKGKEFNVVERMMALPAGRRAAAPSTPEPDFDGFWRQVRAIGKSTDDVRLLLPGQSMNAMPQQTQAELDAMLGRLLSGEIDVDDLPFS